MYNLEKFIALFRQYKQCTICFRRLTRCLTRSVALHSKILPIAHPAAMAGHSHFLCTLVIIHQDAKCGWSRFSSSKHSKLKFFCKVFKPCLQTCIKMLSTSHTLSWTDMWDYSRMDFFDWWARFCGNYIWNYRAKTIHFHTVFWVFCSTRVFSFFYKDLGTRKKKYMLADCNGDDFSKKPFQTMLWVEPG